MTPHFAYLGFWGSPELLEERLLSLFMAKAYLYSRKFKKLLELPTIVNPVWCEDSQGGGLHRKSSTRAEVFSHEHQLTPLACCLRDF